MSRILWPRLYDGQSDALARLKDSKILCGGVGSGKSMVGLAYWAKVHSAQPLRIITTAMKRDSLEWWHELTRFGISRKTCGFDIVIDSWNNIGKYTDCEGAFFIFDEQRLVGNGAWVKAFYKIDKNNDWIMLSATPGDVWMDYVPVMVANGYFKNKSDFTRKHVVWSPYVKYPSVLRYVGEEKLERIAKNLLVVMDYTRHARKHTEIVRVSHSEALYKEIWKERWNPYKQEPLKSAGEVCYTLRKCVNSHPDRIGECVKLCEKFDRVIIFYSFDYELEILRTLGEILEIPVYERNGHKHDILPEGNTGRWVYLVNYAAGAEAWNCVDTNIIIFYSLSYSWKTMVQAEGRIDRRNTTYKDLYYYRLVSDSRIDKAITNALENKKTFNERKFVGKEH